MGLGPESADDAFEVRLRRGRCLLIGHHHLDPELGPAPCEAGLKEIGEREHQTTVVLEPAPPHVDVPAVAEVELVIVMQDHDVSPSVVEARDHPAVVGPMLLGLRVAEQDRVRRESANPVCLDEAGGPIEGIGCPDQANQGLDAPP